MKRILLPLILLSGCFSPSFKDGLTPCQSDHDCPPGLHCAADNKCWSANHNPAPPDLAVPDLSMTVTDGGAVDQASSDLVTSDMTPIVDMTPPVDLLPLVVPAATVWTSNVGGALTGSNGAQLNFSCGGVIVAQPPLTSSNNDTFSFGYLSTDTR
jgi:hypothetical protein